MGFVWLSVLCVFCGVQVWGLSHTTPKYKARLVTMEDALLQDEPIVNTTRGPVLGRTTWSYRELEVQEFLGIPYSEPPTGSRRWKKSVPLAEGWSGVLNGTTYGIHCIQGITDLYPLIGIGGEHGEDCLTLNVFRPKSRAGALPVMVFAHGGGFGVGSSEMYPGTDLASVGGLVVVNFNYRLNSLGFLSTGDAEAPGNYGLWDARLALQWVKENVAQFGGDPTRVTLFGQSAGGALASHCLLSPQMNGLVHRIFAISGAAVAPFALTYEAGPSAFHMADYFNCSATTSEEVVNCLMEQDGEDLFNAGNMIVDEDGRSPRWLPVIDGDFIPVEPLESWEQGGGNINDVDFITGNTIHDAAAFVLLNPIGLPLINDSLNIAYDKELLFEAVLGFLGYAENAEELFDLIVGEYPGLDSEGNMTRTLAATKAGTEGLFEWESDFEASKHADAGGANTYRYLYEYRHSFYAEGYPSWVQGSHTDDMYTYLGPAYFQTYRDYFLFRDFDQTDLDFSEETMKYMANFAYTGNPNTGPFTPNVVWPQYDSTEKKYLHLNPEFSIREPDQDTLDKYDFWETLPIIPRRPDGQDNRYRLKLTKGDINFLFEQNKHDLHERIGFYKPGTNLIDNHIEEVVELMRQLGLL